MARYGSAASKSVERAMHKRKRGTLKSGGSHTKVTSRKQAIAIGLSEAREKGAKVPSAPRSGRRGTSRTHGRSSSTRTRRASASRSHARSVRSR